MKKPQNSWAVVRVWRGLAEGVELFLEEEPAWERAAEIRSKLPESDDVNVFQVPIPDCFHRMDTSL